MKTSSMIRSLSLVFLGILGAGVFSGCDGRQDGEDTSTDSVSKTAPATGSTDQEKEIATQRLQLSLGNDTATPESVKKELTRGADPRWVGDLGDNRLWKLGSLRVLGNRRVHRRAHIYSSLHGRLQPPSGALKGTLMPLWK